MYGLHEVKGYLKVQIVTHFAFNASVICVCALHIPANGCHRSAWARDRKSEGRGTRYTQYLGKLLYGAAACDNCSLS